MRDGHQFISWAGEADTGNDGLQAARGIRRGWISYIQNSCTFLVHTCASFSYALPYVHRLICWPSV